jgi:hypothetical protein
LDDWDVAGYWKLEAGCWLLVAWSWVETLDELQEAFDVRGSKEGVYVGEAPLEGVYIVADKASNYGDEGILALSLEGFKRT